MDKKEVKVSHRYGLRGTRWAQWSSFSEELASLGYFKSMGGETDDQRLSGWWTHTIHSLVVGRWSLYA